MVVEKFLKRERGKKKKGKAAINNRIATLYSSTLTEALDTICGLPWMFSKSGCIEAFTWSLRLHCSGQIGLFKGKDVICWSHAPYLLKDI